MESPKKRKRIEKEGTDQGGVADSDRLIEQATTLLAAPPGPDEPTELRKILQSVLDLHLQSISDTTKEQGEEQSKEEHTVEQLWEEVGSLKKQIETLTKQKKKIAASSLSPYGALQAFDLDQGSYHIEQVGLLEPPEWVLEHHARVRKLVLCRAARGEAYAHLLIDPVIMGVLIQQRQRSSDYARKHDLPTPIPLRLVLEDHLQATVSIKGQDVVVQGKADYAVYYDDEPYHLESERNTKFEAGIVAIEAKKSGMVHEAMSQLIAYMGMIHRERKIRGKDNCTVWGFASDGFDYIFTRIDELGRFRKSMIKHFDEEGRSEVFGTLCSMFDAAALSSPNTSPIKDREAHQKVLTLFRSPERAGQFDYGVSKEVFGTEETSAAKESVKGD